MDDQSKLKISQTMKLPKQVKSIISFKNEKDENIIAVGLNYINNNPSNSPDINSNPEQNKNKQIYFFNVTQNTEWGFNLYNPEKKTEFSIDYIVFYLEEQINYLIATRCSYEPDLLIFDYKSGEILRKITVPRTECLLFNSFKYRGIRRFAYEVNKQDLNIVDFESSGILVPITYQDFVPEEAKKIRFISNRLILILAGIKTNGTFVIRFLDVDSRQIILEHGLQNLQKEVIYHITPLRNITKFCKVILNFDNDEITSGMLCLKYNIDGTIINEKYANDLNFDKTQRFLMKWGDNCYELIDLVENEINVLDFNTWKVRYTVNLGELPTKLAKIKINNIYYLSVLYEDGRVNLFSLKV